MVEPEIEPGTESGTVFETGVTAGETQDVPYDMGRAFIEEDGLWDADIVLE